MKATQKYIKSLLNGFRHYGAVDCTNYDTDDYNRIIEKEGHLDEFAYSVGTYGCNGAAFVGWKTGTYYVITKRSSALFIFR